MQQEHRIILTTPSCGFGSRAPSQVTAPCDAGNQGAGSHPASRPGSAPRGSTAAAPDRTHATFVRSRRSPHRAGRRDVFSLSGASRPDDAADGAARRRNRPGRTIAPCESVHDAPAVAPRAGPQRRDGRRARSRPALRRMSRGMGAAGQMKIEVATQDPGDALSTGAGRRNASRPTTPRDLRRAPGGLSLPRLPARAGRQAMHVQTRPPMLHRAGRSADESPTCATSEQPSRPLVGRRGPHEAARALRRAGTTGPDAQRRDAPDARRRRQRQRQRQRRRLMSSPRAGGGAPPP
jgi:hypothetical protein